MWFFLVCHSTCSEEGRLCKEWYIDGNFRFRKMNITVVLVISMSKEISFLILKLVFIYKPPHKYTVRQNFVLLTYIMLVLFMKVSVSSHPTPFPGLMLICLEVSLWGYLTKGKKTLLNLLPQYQCFPHGRGSTCMSYSRACHILPAMPLWRWYNGLMRASCGLSP